MLPSLSGLSAHAAQHGEHLQIVDTNVLTLKLQHRQARIGSLSGGGEAKERQ